MKQPPRFQFKFPDNRPVLQQALADNERPLPLVPSNTNRAPAVVPEQAPEVKPDEKTAAGGAEGSAAGAGIAAVAGLASGLMAAGARKEAQNINLKNKAQMTADNAQAEASQNIGKAQMNAFGSLMQRWKQSFLGK